MLSNFARRHFSQTIKMPPRIELKALPYEIGALEPVISGHQMEFHYGKHHRAYVNNLNALNVQAAEAMDKNDIATYIKLANSIKFNGGGHLNYEFFWECLAPVKQGGGHLPDANSDFRKALESEWGSMDLFQDYFSA